MCKGLRISRFSPPPLSEIQNQIMLGAVANDGGRDYAQDGSGRKPTFFCIINGLSFVRVGVRTERKHIFTWCVVLSASFHNL